jgi:hypothetical protein
MEYAKIQYHFHEIALLVLFYLFYSSKLALLWQEDFWQQYE